MKKHLRVAPYLEVYTTAALRKRLKDPETVKHTRMRNCIWAELMRRRTR